MMCLFAVAMVSVASVQGPMQSTWVPVSGEPFLATLLGLDDAGYLRVRDPNGTCRLLPVDDIEEATFPNSEPWVSPGGFPSRVFLRSGVDYDARLHGGDDNALSIDLAMGAFDSQLPWRYLRGLRIPDERDDDGGFRQAIQHPRRSEDLLFASRPDGREITQLSVRVKSFTGSGVRVEFQSVEQPVVPFDRVYGIVFGLENGAPARPQPRPRILLHLENGPTVEGRLIGSDRVSYRLELDEGLELALPHRFVSRLVVQSTRVEYLSDLAPVAEHTPAFDRVREWLRDATPNGAGIVLGGRSYCRGLCLIPRTTLTFDIDAGRYDVFEATVGIDDRSSTQADAVIRIRADGRLVFEAAGVQLGQTPRPLELPILGVSTLVIEADFGTNFDLGDHCVFAVARLLRS